MNRHRIISTIVMLILTMIATPISAAEIGDMVGSWKNDQTGETLMVKPDFDVEDSLLGHGHAVDADQMAGATVVITFKGPIYCFYFITLTDQNKRMNLLVRGMPSIRDPKCLGGDFKLAD